jgi:hypothetical protein
MNRVLDRSARGSRAFVLGAVIVLSALAGARDAAGQTPSGATAGQAGSTPATAAPNADVEQLRERAAAFWAARVAGDFTKQWELLEPRGRGRMTAAEYAVNRGAVKYLAYQVEDATISGYFGTVNVRLMAQALLVAPGRASIPPNAFVFPDKWVKIRGTWYHTLDEEAGGGAGGAR